MPIEKHIRVLAILHIVHSSLIALLGLFLFWFFIFIGAIADDEDAMVVLAILGVLLLFVLMILAVPGIIAGIGLLLRKKWGKILTLIVGFLKFLDFPLGTALGVYTIVILFRDDAEAFFREQENREAATRSR